MNRSDETTARPASSLWRGMNGPRFLLIALSAALLSGCAGYRLGPVTGEPAGSRSVQFRPFANHTEEPRISEYINESLRKQLQIDGTYRLETDDGADIIVTGEIVGFQRNGLSYLSTDVLTPQDYNLTLIARITAYDRTTGKAKFSQQLVRGRTPVTVGTDLSSAERQAIPILADDLARNTISLLANPPW